ncbi:MAG: outer membrane lipid asymmetry maintenance protein MlaD, partial [Proteobacteria bacterium]|nr:outer membrane lipid asymmetry maintenance protein MlaD [Pseudomonadota bacterium]
IRLPIDTIATISNDGLLGGKYIRLRAGKAREFIKADGKLEKTEDFKSIEDQVSEIIFLAGGSGGSK